MKKNKLLIFGLLMMMFVFLGSHEIKASKLEKKDYVEIKDHLMKENVPEKQIEILIKKLEDGELWDSMSGNYSYIEPQIIEKNYSKTIYPDGSFAISETEEHEENIAMNPRARSIHTARYMTVKKNFGVLGMSFDMDYSRDDSAKKAKILSQYNKSIWTLGMTYSNLKSGYWPDWRSSTNAWMSADVHIVGKIGGSSYTWIKGHVYGDRQGVFLEFK